MELDELREYIKSYAPEHGIRVQQGMTAERYYRGETTVLLQHRKRDEDDNPLRNADNRIPGGFHRILVKQKAAYLFTYPPLFNLGNTKANKRLTRILGDKFPSMCKRLAVDAANNGCAWIHYWDEDGKFKYAPVKDYQLMPIYSDYIEEELIGMIRTYEQIDPDAGGRLVVYEVWDDTTCKTYMRPDNSTIDYLSEYRIYEAVDGTEPPSNTYEHDLGKVPFIRFKNNEESVSDLTKTLKGLIDSYDKTYCGFVNDLEDIQEIIFILSGYEGENLNGFLQDLKKYKAVKLDADEDSKSGLQTLNIEIPVEAREKLLEITRKAIFEQGHGMDPIQESFGTKSGEALKFMYALLELKAGDVETEFRSGFAELVRVICSHEKMECDEIIQTWTRNAIRNDKEQADICSGSVGVISNRTIVANHPFVDNVESELDYIKQEKREEDEDQDMLDDTE